MNIQWYPGHMTKARREMQESLKLVDMVIELLDARIPRSSRNPDIDSICGNKPRIVALNKSDLADKTVNTLWMGYFNSKGLSAVEIDSLSGRGVKKIVDMVAERFKERDEKLKLRGIVSKPVRIMIAGVPNVGKSSLINRLSGKASAKTGDKPGVTKGKQWIRLTGGLELLDTPGILWPKFENEDVGFNLAFTGAIKDEIMDITELCASLIEKLRTAAPGSLNMRYGVDEREENPGIILEQIGKNRGCILSGGVIDYERAAKTVLDEFRGGKLGRISLERP